MDLNLGRVGNLFSRLPLRNVVAGGGRASMQIDALLQGSRFAQEELANRGLIDDPRVDPRVVAAKSYEVSKGQQFGPSYFNVPAKLLPVDINHWALGFLSLLLGLFLNFDGFSGAYGFADFAVYALGFVQC